VLSVDTMASSNALRTAFILQGFLVPTDMKIVEIVVALPLSAIPRVLAILKSRSDAQTTAIHVLSTGTAETKIIYQFIFDFQSLGYLSPF